MTRVKLRLYRAHDFDILSLYLNLKKKEFSKTVRKILTAYARGEPFDSSGITLSGDGIIAPEVGDRSAAVTCNLTISEKDKEAEALIMKVKPSKQAAFIKSVIRVYLFDVLSSVWFDDGTSVPVFVPGVPAVHVPAAHDEPAAKKTEKKKEEKAEKKKTGTEDPAPPNVLDEDPDSSDMNALADLFGGLSFD